MSGPKETPIPEGVISRVVRGVRYMISGVGPDNFFGPGQPISPSAQEAAGRRFDYASAYNIRIGGRGGEGGGGDDNTYSPSFATLRALAENSNITRIILEARKDEVEKFDWHIKKRDVPGQETTESTSAAQDPIAAKIQQFFQYPDGYLDYSRFLRAMLEDVFVIDALTLYPRYTIGGELGAIELVDGATIMPKLDESGRTPLPPSPAYQQIIKGVPAVDYSRDELIYRPRNVRSHRVFGFSPIEQTILTINMDLRKDYSKLASYTEGNVPESLIGVPDTWTPNQIKEFQETWDAMLIGDLAKRRRAKFIPGQIANNYVPTRQLDLKDEEDEWIARKLCFSMRMSPLPFIKQTNRAVSESMQKASKEDGLAPLMRYVKTIFDFIIAKYFQRPDFEFAWKVDDETDELSQANANCQYIGAGVRSRNEVRALLGDEPIEGGDVHTITTASGLTRLDTAIKEIDPVQIANDAVAAHIASQPPAPGAQPGGKSAPASPPKPGAKPVTTAQKPGVGKAAATPFVAKRGVKIISNVSPEMITAVAALSAKIRATLRVKAKLVAHSIPAMPLKITGRYQPLGAIRKADPEDIQAMLDAVDLGDFGNMESDLGAAAEPVYADSAAAAAFTADFAYSTAQISEAAVAYADARAAELVTNIENTTRDLIRQDVVDALSDPEGYSSASLADTLEENYAFSADRADMIARTELAFANARGALDTYAKSGAVDGKYWVLGPEPCEECQANADQGTIPLDEDFDSGDDAPPAHPNCVCDLIPVLSGDESDSGGSDDGADDTSDDGE